MLSRFLLLMVLFVVIARTFWRFVDGVVRGASGPAPQGGRRAGPPAAVKMQQCPVCGTYVLQERALAMKTTGGTAFFCSERCRSAYDAQAARPR